jgi:peptidyl-prolyl cis-trans isomerase C
MKKHVLTAAVGAILLISNVAIAQNVAIVNGKAVPNSRVEQLTAEVTKSGRPVTPEISKQIKDEVIAREIFIQEAEKRGLATTDDYKMQMELARQTILIRQLFADFQKTNAVTEADLKAEYDKFSAANSGKEFKARHILVEKEADAKGVMESLKKGQKFEDLAKKLSKDAGSGAKGGDLDWANPSNYVPEFAEALTKLAKGQTTTAPVKSQFGYHIIRVDDIRTAQLPKFEEVKPQISQQLTQQKLAKFQEDLRAKAKVE